MDTQNHNLIDQIISSHKPVVWGRLKSFLHKNRVPQIDVIPNSPQEAFEQGYRAGLQLGFLEGFVSGVDLGTDIMWFQNQTNQNRYLN
jgi:hypothetical protein